MSDTYTGYFMQGTSHSDMSLHHFDAPYDYDGAPHRLVAIRSVDGSKYLLARFRTPVEGDEIIYDALSQVHPDAIPPAAFIVNRRVDS